MKRKFKVLIPLLLFLLFITSCGKKEEEKVEIGESELFDKGEIEKAMDQVREEIAKNKDLTLKKIVYDEERSDKDKENYFSHGRGSINGAKEEDTIILFTDIYSGDPQEGRGFEPNTLYEDYSWILIRDGKEGDWEVDDSGY